VQALERDNYRMDCPTYANDAVYNIMKQCWHTDPEGRPSFNDVSQVRSFKDRDCFFQRLGEH
jgi:hypothetical protein